MIPYGQIRMGIDVSVLVIFCLVYIGMVLGNWRGLALDRTGIALLGAIAMMVAGNLSPQQALADIDISSISVLFSFMIISAQFYFSGFYTRIAHRFEKTMQSPEALLFRVIVVVGILSAVLINDIVCLAFTPLLIRACSLKKLNPLPFLLGLACASNVGSAFTLIGNPQNILIGQVLKISFSKYIFFAAIPCLIGLPIIWWVIKWQMKGQWNEEYPSLPIESPPFDAWQSVKGIIAVVLLVIIFLFFNVPRDRISLIVAGFLLLSRRFTSKLMLNFIDWQLLVLFIGLFVVNYEFNKTEMMQSALKSLNLQSPTWLFPTSVILSNLISNVPAAMVLLPFATNDFTGSLLAISSTFAGNMFIVGSLANIIVVTQAANLGIRISWKKHILIGLPITLITLGVAAGWLYLLRFF